MNSPKSHLIQCKSKVFLPHSDPIPTKFIADRYICFIFRTVFFNARWINRTVMLSVTDPTSWWAMWTLLSVVLISTVKLLYIDNIKIINHNRLTKCVSLFLEPLRFLFSPTCNLGNKIILFFSNHFKVSTNDFFMMAFYRYCECKKHQTRWR